jgi:hypothetical protein
VYESSIHIQGDEENMFAIEEEQYQSVPAQSDRASTQMTQRQIRRQMAKEQPAGRPIFKQKDYSMEYD